MFNEQKGCCAICSKHQTTLKRSLAVDHCHATGKVRGLLCQKCNSLIGYGEDNVEILTSSIRNLDKYKGENDECNRILGMDKK